MQIVSFSNYVVELLYVELAAEELADLVAFDDVAFPNTGHTICLLFFITLLLSEHLVLVHIIRILVNQYLCVILTVMMSFQMQREIAPFVYLTFERFHRYVLERVAACVDLLIVMSDALHGVPSAVGHSA